MIDLEAKQKRQSRLAMNFTVAGLAALMILRDLFQVSFSKYVFVAFLGIMFIAMDKTEIYCVVAFLTPFCRALPYTYIFAAVLLVIFFKKSKVGYDKIGIFYIIAILLIELLSVTQGDFQTLLYLRFFVTFLVAFLIIFDRDMSYDYEQMLILFIIGFFVAIVCLWGQMLRMYTFSEIITQKGFRFGNARSVLEAEDQMMISYNQNDLGSLCTITGLFSLLLGLRHKSYWLYLITGFAALQGVMTGSRTFVLVFSVSIIAFFFLSATSPKIAFRNTIILLLAIAVIYFVLRRYLSTYMDNLFDRFEVDDVTNGRIGLLQEYFEKWTQSYYRILFGSGIQNYQAKYGASNSAHNAPQEVLVTWGITGLVIVLCLYIRFLASIRQLNPKAHLVQCIPLIAYMMIGFSGQLFSNYANLLRVMITFCACLMPLELQKHTKPKGRVANHTPAQSDTFEIGSGRDVSRSDSSAGS